MLIPAIHQLNPGLKQRRSLLVSSSKLSWKNGGANFHVKTASFGWYIPISSMVSGLTKVFLWIFSLPSSDVLTKMSAWNSPSRSVAASSARKDTKFLRRWQGCWWLGCDWGGDWTIHCYWELYNEKYSIPRVVAPWRSSAPCPFREGLAFVLPVTNGQVRSKSGAQVKIEKLEVPEWVFRPEKIRFPRHPHFQAAISECFLEIQSRGFLWHGMSWFIAFVRKFVASIWVASRIRCGIAGMGWVSMGPRLVFGHGFLKKGMVYSLAI